jgi:hypothetical protein
MFNLAGSAPLWPARPALAKSPSKRTRRETGNLAEHCTSRPDEHHSTFDASLSRGHTMTQFLCRCVECPRSGSIYRLGPASSFDGRTAGDLYLSLALLLAERTKECALATQNQRANGAASRTIRDADLNGRSLVGNLRICTVREVKVGSRA